MTAKEIEDYFYCDMDGVVYYADQDPRPDKDCIKSCSMCQHCWKLIAICR